MASAGCADPGVHLQVLGSGGPELNDGRASSSYLIWVDGKARVLIDMGSGSLLRFEQSGARVNDLDVLLFSHFHVDHSSDLPALIKASYFSARQRDLPLYGPGGNALVPSATQFVAALFGRQGAYAYLNEYIDGREAYRLKAYDVDNRARKPITVYQQAGIRVLAVGVEHGPIPALAWRIEVGGHSFVISGDMNNQRHSLAGLAEHADLLVAHHAIPETAGAAARTLHMPPSEIGRIAARAGVGRLVLSHRMRRTLGRETQSSAQIRRFYRGRLDFAEDLDCY